MEQQIDFKSFVKINKETTQIPHSNDGPRATINLLAINKKKNINMLTEKLLKEPDEMYFQRKSMQTAYQALFSALWRLPDKNVQQRVLNAINGKVTTFATTATQTDLSIPTDVEAVATTTPDETRIPSTISLSPASLSNTFEASTIMPTMETSTAATTTLVKKQRKRKRRILLPQVSKESHTLRALRNYLPKVNNTGSTQMVANHRLIKSNKQQISDYDKKNVSKRMRLDSISYLLPEICSDMNYDNYLNMELFENTHNKKEALLKEMIKEHIVAPIMMANGLLPIHETILENHLIRLKRQIYIWQEIRQIDLNELLTNEEEDCLQLALINNCIPAIIELLLLKGLNVNSVDNHSNTVIHLAIIHDNEVMSLRHLLQRIDLQQLLKLNDDGYTPLHLAVKYERYILAEYLLNVLDKPYLDKIYYDRYAHADTNMDKEVKIHDESDFTNYYKGICSNIDTNEGMVERKEGAEENVGSRNHLRNSSLKTELLNARDMCTGSTALLLAMQNKLESFIYLLLAHRSDPCVENFSEQNAKSFYNDFGRSMGLNLDIDDAMEKVIKLLQITN